MAELIPGGPGLCGVSEASEFYQPGTPRLAQGREHRSMHFGGTFMCGRVCVCVRILAGYMTFEFASELFYGSKILNVFDRICTVGVCVCVYLYAFSIVFISTSI